jgi:3-deoxy-D-manno-octulosonate 8-phosphate phosphatase (KDO 8-P phosphatase)
LYTSEEKFAKVFGPHDNDGIKMIRKYLEVIAISADKRGSPITKKRVQEDMGLPLFLVSEDERMGWFESRDELDKTIYMGDGIYDAKIFEKVGYSIAPNNAFYMAKEKASFVTKANSGEGAVAEACLHVLEKFFKIKF